METSCATVAAERAVDERVPVLDVEAEQELGHLLTLRSGALKRLAPTILVAALLVATATAFAVTEHLKLEDSPVINTRFPALFSPRLAEERIGFRLRREEEISLAIAGANGKIVKQAVGSGVFGQAFHQFAWRIRARDSRPFTGRKAVTWKDLFARSATSYAIRAAMRFMTSIPGYWISSSASGKRLKPTSRFTSSLATVPHVRTRSYARTAREWRKTACI